MTEVYVLIDGQENEILGVFDDVQYLSEIYCNSLEEDEEKEDFLIDIDKVGLFNAIQERGQYVKTLSVNPETI